MGPRSHSPTQSVCSRQRAPPPRLRPAPAPRPRQTPQVRPPQTPLRSPRSWPPPSAGRRRSPGSRRRSGQSRSPGRAGPCRAAPSRGHTVGSRGNDPRGPAPRTALLPARRVCGDSSPGRGGQVCNRKAPRVEREERERTCVHGRVRETEAPSKPKWCESESGGTRWSAGQGQAGSGPRD